MNLRLLIEGVVSSRFKRFRSQLGGAFLGEQPKVQN